MSQRERDAFVAGVLWRQSEEISEFHETRDYTDQMRAEALRRYPDETPEQEPVCAYCGKPEEHFAHNQDGHAFQEPEFRWWCMECGAKLYTEVEMREHEHKGKWGYIAGMTPPAREEAVRAEP
jgi:hypothetical protein